MNGDNTGRSNSDKNTVLNHLHFYVIGFFNALIVAILLPTMSLYAYQFLSASPIQVSLFLGLYACAGIVYTHMISMCREAIGQLKTIALGICASTLAALAALSFCNSYWVALILAVLFLAAYQALAPLIMGIAHAHFSAVDIVKVNTRLVAAAACAWVIGPLIGFYTIRQYGFSWLFVMLCFIVFVLSALIFLIPSQRMQEYSAEAHGLVFRHLGKANIKRVLPAVVLLLLVSLSVTLYQHLLPIYFTQKKLHIEYLGWIFSFSALIEIGVILLSTKLVKKAGFALTFFIASSIGTVFFLMLPFSDHHLMLFGLQILKGIFYGLYAGSGVNWLQSILPEQPTFCASFFHNSISVGVLLAGFMSGIIIGLVPAHLFYVFSALAAFSCSIYLLVNIFLNWRMNSRY